MMFVEGASGLTLEKEIQPKNKTLQEHKSLLPPASFCCSYKQSSTMVAPSSSTVATLVAHHCHPQQPQQPRTALLMENDDEEETPTKSSAFGVKIRSSVSFAEESVLCQTHTIEPSWTLEKDDLLWYSESDCTDMKGDYESLLKRLEMDQVIDEPHIKAFQALYEANKVSSTVPIDKELRSKIVHLYLATPEWVGLEKLAIASKKPTVRSQIQQMLAGGLRESTKAKTTMVLLHNRQKFCQAISQGDTAFALNTAMAMAATIMLEAAGDKIAENSQNQNHPNNKTNLQRHASASASTNNNNNRRQHLVRRSSMKSDISSRSLDSSNHAGSTMGAVIDAVVQREEEQGAQSQRSLDAHSNHSESRRKPRALDTLVRRSSQRNLMMTSSSDHGDSYGEGLLANRRRRASVDGGGPRPKLVQRGVSQMHLLQQQRRTSLETSSTTRTPLARASSLMDISNTAEEVSTVPLRRPAIKFHYTLVTSNKLQASRADVDDDSVLWYSAQDLAKFQSDVDNAPETMLAAKQISKHTGSIFAQVFEKSKQDVAIPEKLVSKLLDTYVEHTDVIGLEYVLMGLPERQIQAARLSEIRTAIRRVRESVSGPLQHRAILQASLKVSKQARDFAVRRGMGQAAAATVLTAGEKPLMKRSTSFKKLDAGDDEKLEKTKSSRKLDKSGSSRKLEKNRSSRKLNKSGSSRKLKKESSSRKIEKESSRRRIERETHSHKESGKKNEEGSKKDKIKSKESKESHSIRKEKENKEKLSKEASSQELKMTKKGHADRQKSRRKLVGSQKGESSRKLDKRVSSRKLDKATSSRKLNKKSSCRELKSDIKKDEYHTAAKEKKESTSKKGLNKDSSKSKLRKEPSTRKLEKTKSTSESSRKLNKAKSKKKM